MTQVDVTVFNRRTRFRKPYPKALLQTYFRFRPNNYFWMPTYKLFLRDPDTGKVLRDEEGKPLRVWDGYINLLNRHKVGTGLFFSMKKQIESEYELQFKIEDRRRKLKFKEIDYRDAWPFQIDCFEAMKKSISGGLILAATRVGKTRISGMYFRAVTGGGVFVVDELHLLEQSRRELEKEIGEKVGKIGDEEFLPERISVATIQTLSLHSKSKRFRKWVSTLKVMFLDELHLQLNKRSIEVVNHILPRVVFGLTATLELKKQNVRMNALNLCGPIVYEYPIETGVQQGYLTPGIVVSIPVRQQDFEFFNYQNAYNDLIVQSQERTQVITSLIEEGYKQGKSILLLVERIKHLKKLSALLSAIPHQIVYGKRAVPERIEAVQDFDQKKCRLILANKVFAKGITLKAVDMIVEASAMKSKNSAVQKYGRGIGLCKGKSGMIFYDISDRSIDGIKRDHKNWNRFHRSTVSRLNAFKAKNITVRKLEQELDPVLILEQAQKWLSEEIKRVSSIMKRGA